jgi:imidazolonepropionase-like amidohydrolase
MKIPSTALCVASILAIAQDAPAQSLVAIRGASVIDGSGSAARSAYTVVVRNDRIAALGPSRSTAIPRGARVIDGSGLYLVPGFIDMHAHYALGPITIDQNKNPPTMRMAYDHAAARASLGTLLQFGITTIRNPGGPTRESVALRDSVRLGLVSGPRIFTAGEVLDATNAAGLVTSVRTAEEVRAEVARQVSLGVDYIKLYALLRPELIRAGIEEAHKRGVKALAHLYLTTWTDAAMAGIDGIVHVTPGSADLLPASRRQAFQTRLRGTQFMLEWFNFVDLASPEIRDMTRALVQNRVTVDPTLVTFEAIAWGDSARITAAPDLQYAPKSLVDGWRGNFTLTSGWKPEDYAEARRAWPNVLAFTKHLHDAGVLLTAGTDMGNPWTVPGTSFHRELELLAAAGIPPLAVLSIATRNGAESLGKLAEFGTIAVGKYADMVALQGDPTADIRNTRRIAWVMQAGTLLPGGRPASQR